MINNRELYKIQKELESIKNNAGATFEKEWGTLTTKDSKVPLEFVEKVRSDMRSLGSNYEADKNILIIKNRFGYIAMCGWYNAVSKASFKVSTHYITTNQIGRDHKWTFVAPGWYNFLNIRYDLDFNKNSHWNDGYFGPNYQYYYNLGLFPTGKDEMEVVYCDSSIVSHQLSGYSDNHILCPPIGTDPVVVSDGKDVRFKRAPGDMINKYSGVEGQILINTDDNTIHVMDGIIEGGHKVAKQKDLEKVFTLVSNGKKELETAIIDKGGEVSKENDIPTFSELANGIKDTVSEDVIGKQKMLDVVLAKIPSLEGVLTIKSPLSEFAKYMMLIGPTNLILRDTLEQIKTHDINTLNTISNVIIESALPNMKIKAKNDTCKVIREIECRFTKLCIKNNINNIE